MDEEFLARLQTSLQRPTQAMPMTEWTLRAAAVLIPLTQIEREWHVLLTRRADDLSTHSGQVAFPGGTSDGEGETEIDTALREAYEEVGILPSDVRVMGTLRGLLTVSGFWVTPVVGVIPHPYPLVTDPAETAATFYVPISWLAEPSHLEVRQRQHPITGKEIPVYYYRDYNGFTIWGVTAFLLREFLQLWAQIKVP
ncbi:MAG TPA: CoA pyrophosphatase [Anaerolineales bacterium]|nr:CoA pyrophosphatase [Anaerolineales bacterium]